jgi:hypothetical protein
MPVPQMPFCQLPVSQLPVGQLPVGQMPVSQMIFDPKTRSPLSLESFFLSNRGLKLGILSIKIAILRGGSFIKHP